MSDIASDEIDFSWGAKRGRGGKKKEVQFYESFSFDGVEYSLYDCVYLYKEGESKPYVGKILKIWELPNKERKVKILWFFYPSEISNFLIGESVLENELFLATGVGKGLTNVNPLESIAGKCNVVCISKDKENRRQPSFEEVKKAYYVFYRTFDVDNHSISEKFGDKIATIEVHLLLNKINVQSPDLPKLDSENVTVDLDELLTSINNSIAADDAAECDACDDSLVVKDTSSLPESKRKDENATNDVPKLLDSGKNSIEDSVVPITAAENRNSKLEIGKRKPTSAAAKGKTDDRPLKKLKLGETSTPKPAIVESNKTTLASESNDRGRSFKEFNGVSNGLSENKSKDKLAVVSVNQSKDKQPQDKQSKDKQSIDKQSKDKQLKDKQSKDKECVGANKTSQLANGDAANEDKHNVNKKLVGSGNGISKKWKSNSVVEDKSNDKLHKLPTKEEPESMKIEASQCVKEVTRRPPDRSKWFTASPWEDRMKEAYDQGRLVLLHNLNQGYTSSDVEDIIWHGFEENCTAKVVQHTASFNKFFGQAFVIFKTRDIAEKVLRKLDTHCLMLPNGRPLVASRGVVYNPPAKNSSFPGHLVIDKLRHQMQKESREAVSTSHSSQPNTLEYEMAIEWRLLQDRADLWWKMLYKRQGEEIKKAKASLKSLRAS